MTRVASCLAALPEPNERGLGAERADRVREAIEAAGLTLYRVSALTARGSAKGGGDAAIPHTFYRDIRAGQVPTIHQLAALSRVTRQPLASWLSLFGLDVSRLMALQVRLHEERTVRLPARLFESSMDIARWTRLASGPAPDVGCRSASDVGCRNPSWEPEFGTRRRGGFVVLRIGRHSHWRAAEIAAGSLVRVDVRQRSPGRFDRRPAIYAVAHAHGISCCYVDALSPQEMVLFGADEDSPALLRLDRDALVLGRVDAELRLPAAHRLSEPPAKAARQTGPVAWPDARHDPVGRFLQRARLLAGLTFRDAEELTARVAEACGDSRFHLSIGALCNYETLDEPPTSPHALFTLAAIYAFDLQELLERVGAHPAREGAGTQALWLPDEVRQAFDLPAIDARDVFVFGPRQRRLDVRLIGAVLVGVDRRDRRLTVESGTAAEAPLFVLRVASEALVCCSASLHGSSVLVHPSPDLGLGARRLPREHVEVLGRVFMVLRKLPR
jgi:transcriptional regulator with XRE-family HTH domain